MSGAVPCLTNNVIRECDTAYCNEMCLVTSIIQKTPQGGDTLCFPKFIFRKSGTFNNFKI